MFTSAYFKDHYRDQVESVGFDAIARLHLLSGESYFILKVGGYVLLTIYPQEATDLDSLEDALKARRRDGSPKTIHDQLAVPYENISHVTFTAVKPKRTHVGFKET